MKARRRRKAASMPKMMANMTKASLETITYRSILMAQNACPPEEYVRMVQEKTEAAMESGMKWMMSGGLASMESLMAPWHRRAVANAKRLRDK
jgi:hypothetical protein